MSRDVDQTTRIPTDGKPDRECPSEVLIAIANRREGGMGLVHDVSAVLKALSLGISGLEVRDADPDPLNALVLLALEMIGEIDDDREEMRQKWWALKESHEDLEQRHAALLAKAGGTEARA